MNTYGVGQVVHFRDFNLRHPTQAMTVISHIGDTVRVKHASGNCGDWLSRDLIDPLTEGTNTPPRIGTLLREIKNDCLGKSWAEIESMQGGKLK